MRLERRPWMIIPDSKILFTDDIFLSTVSRISCASCACSPGMEVGDKFMPYQVLLLKRDGSAEVYADIHSPVDQ